MNEFVKLLDKDLEYMSHDLIDDTFYIHVYCAGKTAECPFCGTRSSNAHSYYERYFQELPIQGKLVVIQLRTRRMFCKHTTFAERYSFLSENAKQTNRLKEYIIKTALETSSIVAAEVLERNAIKTIKNTICLMLKKVVPLWIKNDVFEVCMDDFAIRKGCTWNNYD